MKETMQKVDCVSIKQVGFRLFLKIKNETYIDNDLLGGDKLLSTIEEYNGDIYYTNAEGYHKLNQEINKKELIIRDTEFTSFRPLGQYLLAFQRISNTARKYCLVDYNNNLICEYSRSLRFINILGEYLLQRKALNWDKFTVTTALNKELFHYKFPEGYKMLGTPRLCGSVLFFRSHKGQFRYKRFTGLDINTGKQLWELNYEAPFVENLNTLEINKSDNLGYGISKAAYQVFDPIKGEIVIEKKDVLPEGVVPNRQALYDNKLWFVCGKGEEVKFGAFDIKKQSLDFVQDFPLELDEQLDNPVYHNGKLYLRGLHYHKLHILE